MAIASGLGSAFGVVDESVYGTLPASPTWRWYDPMGKQPDLKLAKNVVQGGGLASGRLMEPAARRVITSRSGSIGSLSLEVLNTKLGYLLKHIFGGTVTPVQQAATTAYLQTHTLVDNIGKSFDAQVQVPQTDGTVRAFTGRGGKITSAEFSCETDGLLMVDIAADFQNVVDSDAAGAPSYTAGQFPFHFGLMNVKLGALGSEASVSGVRKASVKIERPQATDRLYAGSSPTTPYAVKAEPLMNDFANVTGSLDVDFTDKTVFADRFQADSQASLILQWVGITPIASTYYPMIAFTMPATFFDDGTPTVDDNGVVKTTFNYTSQFDLTNNPITCTYMSTDTTL